MGKWKPTDYRELLLTSMTAELDRLLGELPKYSTEETLCTKTQVATKVREFSEFLRAKREAQVDKLRIEERAESELKDLIWAIRRSGDPRLALHTWLAAHTSSAPPPAPHTITTLKPASFVIDDMIPSPSITESAPNSPTITMFVEIGGRKPARKAEIIPRAALPFEKSEIGETTSSHHPRGKVRLTPDELFDPFDLFGPFGERGPYGDKIFCRLWLMLKGIIQLAIATTWLLVVLAGHLFPLLLASLCSVMVTSILPFIAALYGARNLWKKPPQT